MAKHIANTPAKIDGTARCAVEKTAVLLLAIEESDAFAADTTLEMAVRPCVSKFVFCK